MTKGNFKRTPLVVRLMAKVKRDPAGCWLWTGSTDKNGYGMIGSGGRSGKNILAHRASYAIANGPIPNGLDVMHSCDIPSCVNPQHLTVGTALENHKDAVMKGRVPWAVLTKEQADEIRAARTARRGTGTKLA